MNGRPSARYHGVMDEHRLRQYARDWLEGRLSREAFVECFREAAIASWSSVSLDTDRQSRCGFPEVVYGEGKPVEALIEIAEHFRACQTKLLVTRLAPDAAEALCGRFPTGHHNPVARTWRWVPESLQGQPPIGEVAVVSAGTTDRAVAEEAVETLHWMGAGVTFFQDVGVAGPHRLLAIVPQLRRADALVVVAGMEGALPSVVGGHVAVPVVAVPTSVGYGAAFEGVAALLGMLNSCASNVTVVNIDAGFKGGYVAGLIASRRHGGDPCISKSPTSTRCHSSGVPQDSEQKADAHD